MKNLAIKLDNLLKRPPNALLCALGAVVFLLAFYFVSYRTPLSQVWLPTTMNNDEAIYNRQVVSVIEHGGRWATSATRKATPLSAATTRGEPFLIWAYAIPAFFFGSSVNVVLWCNLLFITLGIAFFARSAKLNVWQCIVLAGSLFAITIPLRSCVSGASEALHYLIAFVIVGSAAALRRSGKTGWLIVLAAACAIETIFRPYALLFWVFPLAAVWGDKRRRTACLATAGVSFAVAVFAMTKLAAAFFSGTGMDFTGFSLLAQGHPFGAVGYMLTRAGKLLRYAWRDDILPTLQRPRPTSAGRA